MQLQQLLVLYDLAIIEALQNKNKYLHVTVYPVYLKSILLLLFTINLISHIQCIFENDLVDELH